MSKFCVKCGKEMDDSARACPNCGAPTAAVNNGSTKKREIVISVLLSFITCGIYGIYWFIVMTDESNNLCSTEKTASGGLSFLYTIITCGIYNFYWNYKMGKKMYEAGKAQNVDIADNSVLYIILAVLGLSIVNYCIIQTDLNKLAQE